MRYGSLGLCALILFLATRSSLALRFRDATVEAGIRFVSTDGQSGRHLFPEFIGQGVALFDYDNDGDLDVYFVNGARLIPPYGPPDRNALYENRGDGTFEDVTDRAGVGDTGYGIGCAVGDVDNDGWLDLFVTNLGANVLYRNRGDGTFEEITTRAGVAEPGFNTGAAFFDYDNDGDLDLYLARYAEYSVEDDVRCAREGVPVYCEPDAYPRTTDRFFRNRGDGTFEDVTTESGIGDAPPAHGFAVAFGDVDEDGFLDLYVANDRSANYLFVNQGDGTFVEDGLFTGVALSAMGKEEAGMGTAMADFDNDGHLDLVVTNFQKETNALYRNDGDGFFTDVTDISGMGEASFSPLGWAVAFPDFDNDGWKDLFVANGHVQDTIERFDRTTTYAQRNLLLRNMGGTRFEDIGPRAGPPFAERWVSRGAAVGDIDNDGDVDLVIANWNGRPNLLLNEDGNRNGWVIVRTVGTESNRFGVGARVIVSADRKTQMNQVGGAGSFLSHGDLRVLIGLGSAERVDSLEVRWPSGRVDRYRDLPARAFVTVTEGDGVRVGSKPTGAPLSR